MPVSTALIATLLITSSAQTEPDTSARALKADLAVLKQAYGELHPGLLRYNTPKQLERNYDQLARAWGRDQSLRDAYLGLSEFLAKIKCGHTYANFFNQTAAVKAELFEKLDKVPFAFRWIKGHMVVTRDASGNGAFPRGSIITAVNGVPTGKILSQLMKVARADGNNQAKRIDYLEVTGTGEYEAFDVYFPLYFPVKGQYQFVMTRPGAKQSEVVQAKPIKMSDRITSEPQPASDAPGWSLSYPRANTARLTMPSWVLYNSKWDWKSYLRTAFTEFNQKAIKNLILDLRGNEGGDSVGDVILEHLVQTPLASESFQRFVRYRKVSEGLRPYLETWDKSFYDWGSFAKPDANGFFKLTRWDDLAGNIIRGVANPFRGKVFVIIGPVNSSATFEFAFQVKRLRLGTLVGRPTGGSQRGINGGAFFFLRLPNSKLEVDVPLIAQFYPDNRPDKGVEPDVPVEATATDIAAGRDVEMERIYKLIGA